MLENYDGYLFNKNLSEENRTFNATLVMYFLREYDRFKVIIPFVKLSYSSINI